MNANQMEVTKEEEEAMDALCRLGAGVPLLNISDGGRTVQYATPQFSPQPSAEVLHKPDVTTIINNICEQLSLLATVINQTKAQPNTTPPEGNPPEKSLQECVSAVLQQADWFKEMFEDAIENQVGDMNSTIEDRVDAFFSHSFSLDDHVDIDGLVSDKVDDSLAEIVEEKFRDVRVSFG
jgi:hypothetical protein